MIDCLVVLTVALFIDILHLEDNFKCSVENFVQTFLFFGGAHHETLESVLFGSCLYIRVRDGITQFSLVSLSLQLFTKIELCANQNAGACSSRCLDF